MMRAKFSVNSVLVYESQEEIKMTAITDGNPEDNTYAKFTPAGELSITITNPALFRRIQPGETYFLDFTLAEQAKPIDK